MKRSLDNILLKKNLNHIDLTFLITIISFLFIGIMIYDDYGISWDEYWHRINGFVSLNLLREIFSLDIYPDLEHVSEFRIKDSKKYGVIFDLPMSFIEKKFLIDDFRQIFLIRHFFNFFTFLISSIFFYKLLNKRFPKIFSLIGVLFLILSPRIFAESFYNMKDLIFLSFFIISLYFAINFLTLMSYKNALFSSFTCSLLIGIKIIGIIVPFIVLIFFVLKTLDNKIFFKAHTFKIIFYLFLLISFTIIVWPYLWNDPINNFVSTLKSFSSYPWRGSIFYFGKYLSALNLPWHYPLVWILITTPVLYLILFFLGSVLILKTIWLRFLDLSPQKLKKNIWMNDNEMIDIIVLLIFYFTLFLVIEIDATLYNGWRHLYFIYPCLIFISIRGLNFISNNFRTKNLIIIILPFLLYTCFWMAKNHPFQFVYFNKLAGNSIAENFELDYWGVSNKNSLTYIAENDKRQKLKIYVFSESPYHFSLLMMKRNERQRFEFVNNIDDANYLVTNHYYQKDVPIEQNKKLLKKFNLYKEYKVDDLIINSIYKIN
jgi:hypothetical protein|tara:strand:- start:846 stop:2477 length:1632 start_codon:yes stop_codon:yes gene_type:complete